MELFGILDHHSVFSDFHALQKEVYDYRTVNKVPEPVMKKARSVLSAMREQCDKMQLDSVADLILNVEAKCFNGDVQPWEVVACLNNIEFLFKSQANKQKFFWLSKDESGCFEQPQMFGSEVFAAFSSEQTRREITEAGNCFALNRYTATVFHLMRVLERGLKALADHLQVPFSVPFEYLNWQNIIEPIEAKIRAIEKQATGPHKTEQLKTFSDIAKQFRYFKDAWRNHVAHSRESYGREEALSIMRHVREFMKDAAMAGLKE